MVIICTILVPRTTTAGGLRDLNMASATSLAASNSKRQACHASSLQPSGNLG